MYHMVSKSENQYEIMVLNMCTDRNTGARVSAHTYIS